MPSTSKKQRNFMAAAAHNPAFAKKVGISQTVAKEFNAADKGKKFGVGGGVGIVHGGKGQINKQTTRAGSIYGQQKEVPNINLNKYIGKKEGGKIMAKKLFGGKETYGEELKEAKAIKSGKITPEQYAKGEESEKPMKKMSKGGSASSRADGCATKGKTKGTMIMMKSGGKACK